MEVFEARAAKYNQLAWVADPDFGRQIVELAQAHSSTVMLDLAAGTGAVALLFCGLVREIYALDSSAGMLEQAREAMKDEDNVRFIHRDGQDTGLPDSFLDLIICRNGLHHFDDPRAGLREVMRILKPDGVFLLIEPVAPSDAGKWPWSELFRVRDKGRHPSFYFTSAELADYVSGEGFVVDRVEGVTIPLSLSNWLDTGSLCEDETAHILRFVGELPAELRAHLEVEATDGDWVWRHHWALLRLKKGAPKEQ
ncbi:MAG: methyltransferase domain-containing protein [Chloroflexi bacterium]|nr:methyltransferase domain-containing protein [Chloroflexota bacterium]